jgi:hypothetical protein
MKTKKKIIVGVFMGIHGGEDDWLTFVTYWRGLKRRLKSITTNMAEF